MASILLNETNTRPAKARDLKAGDVFISATDPFLEDEGASHGSRVEEIHRNPHRWGSLTITITGATIAVTGSKDILIWTGGPVKQPPVNGVYPRQ